MWNLVFNIFPWQDFHLWLSFGLHSCFFLSLAHHSSPLNKCKPIVLKIMWVDTLIFVIAAAPVWNTLENFHFYS